MFGVLQLAPTAVGSGSLGKLFEGPTCAGIFGGGGGGGQKLAPPAPGAMDRPFLTALPVLGRRNHDPSPRAGTGGAPCIFLFALPELHAKAREERGVFCAPG